MLNSSFIARGVEAFKFAKKWMLDNPDRMTLIKAIMRVFTFTYFFFLIMLSIIIIFSIAEIMGRSIPSVLAQFLFFSSMFGMLIAYLLYFVVLVYYFWKVRNVYKLTAYVDYSIRGLEFEEKILDKNHFSVVASEFKRGLAFILISLIVAVIAFVVFFVFIGVDSTSLIPNIALNLVIALFISPLFLMAYLFDFSSARYTLKFGERVKLVLNNYWALWVVGLLVFIPIVQLFALPRMLIASTILFADTVQKKKIDLTTYQIKA